MNKSTLWATETIFDIEYTCLFTLNVLAAFIFQIWGELSIVAYRGYD